MKLYFFIASLMLVQFSFAQEDSSDPAPKIWSLEDCITYALENNITIKDAVLSKNLAEVDYSKAKSSRLPNLFGSASQSFTNGNSIDPITSDFVSDQINCSWLNLNC